MPHFSVLLTALTYFYLFDYTGNILLNKLYQLQSPGTYLIKPQRSYPQALPWLRPVIAAFPCNAEADSNY